MTPVVRRIVLIVICLMSLAFAGPVTAACAADIGECGDCPTTVQSGSIGMTERDMSQNKAHQCAHDACCGYQVAALSEVRSFWAPPPISEAAMVPGARHLTDCGRDPLLDPPRA